jgi:hypothetical protein
MNNKRIAYGVLILSLLACNTITRLVSPATATPLPTATLIPGLRLHLACSSLHPAGRQSVLFTQSRPDCNPDHPELSRKFQ